MNLVLRDVTLRDGLQDEVPVPTAAKVEIFDAVVAAGVVDVELTSFVRPDRVPALADAAELSARVLPSSPIACSALVLNRRGAELALGAGFERLQFVYSVSEPHNERNAGRSVEASRTELAGIVSDAGASARIEATLATAFGCPHVGPVDPAVVLDEARRSLDSGAAGLGLADTVGTATPAETRNLVAAVKDLSPGIPVGVHLHDTRGMALAGALAALDAGVDRIDGAVGGLGGCPFAPGASGNLPLEDLVHCLDATGVDTGIDLDLLLDAARIACARVGRPVASHVGVAGPRFGGTAGTGTRGATPVRPGRPGTRRS